MKNQYLIQLAGILLIALGMTALTALSYLYGTPLSLEERRRTGGNWRNKGNISRLPFNLETLAAAAFLLGGVVILDRTHFDLCSFLVYWLPSLPDSIRLLLACR